MLFYLSKNIIIVILLLRFLKVFLLKQRILNWKKKSECLFSNILAQ